MLQSLTEKGSTSAAETLEHRIAQVAACEFFCVQATLKALTPDKLSKLLLLTQDAWASFPPAVQVKILEHRLHHEIMLPIQQAMENPDKNHAALSKQMQLLAEVFFWQEEAQEHFEVMHASCSSLVKSLLSQGQAAAQAGLGEEVSFSLETAMQEATKDGDKENEQMKGVLHTSQA